MAILTKSRLTAVTETRLGTRLFSESINENFNKSKSVTAVTIFLSHSHAGADQAEVKKAIVLLRRVNANIYIDRNDSGLPPTTGDETAVRLKKKIKDCRKFILLASDNAINSKWCNWELGYGDAYKYIPHIALLPVADDDGEWKGREYLKIYPRIEESDLFPDTFKVVFPDGSSVYLDKWLTA